MSLRYFATYLNEQGVKCTLGTSHSSCWGALSGLGSSIPEGSKVLPVFFVSHVADTKDLRRLLSRLTKEVPHIHVNGRKIVAPKISYYDGRSTRPGSMQHYSVRGNINVPQRYIRVTLQKDISCSEVYPVLKYYLKNFTYPNITSEQFRNRFDRLEKDLVANGIEPTMAVMNTVASHYDLTGNYSFPFSYGYNNGNDIREILKGDIKPVFQTNHPLNQYEFVGGNPTRPQDINYPYVGVQPLGIAKKKAYTSWPIGAQKSGNGDFVKDRYLLQNIKELLK